MGLVVVLSKASFFPILFWIILWGLSPRPKVGAFTTTRTTNFKSISCQLPIISLQFPPSPNSCGWADILACLIPFPPCFFSCKICYFNSSIICVFASLWPKTRNLHYAGITQIHLAHFGSAMQRLLVQVQKVQTALCRNNITRYCCIDSYLPFSLSLEHWKTWLYNNAWTGDDKVVECLYLFNLCIWGAQIISCHPC